MEKGDKDHKIGRISLSPPKINSKGTRRKISPTVTPDHHLETVYEKEDGNGSGNAPKLSFEERLRQKFALTNPVSSVRHRGRGTSPAPTTQADSAHKGAHKGTHKGTHKGAHTGAHKGAQKTTEETDHISPIVANNSFEHRLTQKWEAANARPASRASGRLSSTDNDHHYHKTKNPLVLDNICIEDLLCRELSGASFEDRLKIKLAAAYIDKARSDLQGLEGLDNADDAAGNAKGGSPELAPREASGGASAGTSQANQALQALLDDPYYREAVEVIASFGNETKRVKFSSDVVADEEAGEREALAHSGNAKNANNANTSNNDGTATNAVNPDKTDNAGTFPNSETLVFNPSFDPSHFAQDSSLDARRNPVEAQITPLNEWTDHNEQPPVDTIDITHFDQPHTSKSAHSAPLDIPFIDDSLGSVMLSKDGMMNTGGSSSKDHITLSEIVEEDSTQRKYRYFTKSKMIGALIMTAMLLITALLIVGAEMGYFGNGSTSSGENQDLDMVIECSMGFKYFSLELEPLQNEAITWYIKDVCTDKSYPLETKPVVKQCIPDSAYTLIFENKGTFRYKMIYDGEILFDQIFDEDDVTSFGIRDGCI